MASFDGLEQGIYDAFLANNKQVKSHQAQPHLAWCLQSDSPSFYPSYHGIASFGSNRLSRSTNYLFGSIFPAVRDRFIASIITTIQQRYYTPLSQLSYRISDRELSLCLGSLDNLLCDCWPQIRSWSFTELFSFLNRCCVIFNSYLDLPADLYSAVKQRHYQRCLSMYQLIRDEHFSNLSLHALCYLVIRANWIDSYVDHHRVNQFLNALPGELNDILDQADWVEDFVFNNPYIHYTSVLYAINTAPKHILYELDNQGELLFDLLLIEYCLLKGHSVSISTKHSPILNDITYSELVSLLQLPEFTHLYAYIKTNHLSVVDNGSCDVIPIRYHMSDAYINAYKQADLVIMKGQGNFESYPIKRFFPFYKQSVSYLTPHIYLFVLKSSFTQRSFSAIASHTPLDTLVCYATVTPN